MIKEIRYYKGKYRVEILSTSGEMRDIGQRQVKVLEPFTSWELTIHGLNFNQYSRETKKFEIGEVFITNIQNLKRMKKEGEKR